MKNVYTEPTMTYEYGNDDREYIFLVKGRPFPALVSPYLPTPTATLLDYDLVRSLGLKMTNLQCQKFSYAGFKMRILGKISITVQCIHDGVSSGTFHISKANVVLDLAKNLDSECVAGQKMAAQLRGEKLPPPPAHNPRTPSTPPRALPRGAPSPAPSVPAAAPPRTPPPRKYPSWIKTQPRSPPGFPSPLYAASPGIANIPVLQVSSNGLDLSPLSANVRALASAFNNADQKKDENLQIWAIKDVADGEMDHDNDGNLNYYLDNGYHYRVGHGRGQCHPAKCGNLPAKDYPNNCAFHPQWRLPDGFQPCDDDCQGGFCPCLSLYAPGYEDVLREVRGKKR